MIRSNWVKTVVMLLAACSAASASAQVNLVCRLARPASAAQLAQKYRLRLLDRIPGAPFVLYSARDEASAKVAQARMRLDSRVAWVEDDARFETPEGQAAMRGGPHKGSTLPAVGGRSVLYEANRDLLGQINWQSDLAASTGRAVRVAVLDTGLSPEQHYLWNRVRYALNLVEPGQPPYDVERQQDTNGDGTADQATGHGTMVVGLIDQIAPQVDLSVIRVCDSDGVSTAWRLIKGLSMAVVTRCEVANVSLGSLNQIPALSDVAEWCDEHGLLVVAAIGNNDQDAACYPARFNSSIAVGGLLPDDTKAPFSNYNRRCFFSAPATGIISQWYDGQIGEWSGTSFATPLVAAGIADSLRRTSRLAPSTIRTRIEGAGSSLDSINADYKGKLGVLLNLAKLDEALRGGP